MQDNKRTNWEEQFLPVEEERAKQTKQFLDLYGTAYSRIFACIFSLLPNKIEADEVMQETSMVLWRRFGDFDPEADFVRWACGIACNQIRKLRRERSRSGLQISNEAWERVAAVRDRQTESLDSRQSFLKECVKKLQETDRILLSHSCKRTTSLKQVAEELNRPVNTVYKAMKRIRIALKQCVDLAMRREGRQ